MSSATTPQATKTQGQPSRAPSNPVALVTGGSAGIGREICRALIEEGYTVVSLARRKPDWSHARLQSIDVDLLDAAATREAAADAAARYAPSHLVHNAGVIWPNLVEDVRIEDLTGLTQLHLGAALILTQAVLPAMKAAGFGRIVLMSSRAALGLQTRTAYSATKSGMIGMGRTWALELAPHGITVNMVAPGPIASTEMFHAVVPEDSPKMTEIAQAIPVRRLGAPEDVAHAVLFFASPRASFVTGQVLYVCGGASIGTTVL